MSNAGYSGTPLPKKLGITGESVFAVLHAPTGFAATLGDTGEAVRQQHLMPPLDVVIGFYTERARLLADWPKMTGAAAPDGAVWVCWPKRTAGVATDLTEDVLRAELLPSGWVDNKVCAIDEVWSGLRFVLRKDHRAHHRRR